MSDQQAKQPTSAAPEHDAQDHEGPRVTVIMRTKNSDWVVAQALAGLFSQSYKNFELLVMDSGSTDRTLEILEDYPCRIIHVEAKRYFPGIVLNRAVEEANTDIVVFQNSDVVQLNPDALTNLVAAMDDPNVAAAYARQVPRPEADAWVRRDYAASFPESGDAPTWISISLPFAAMRKSDWEQHPFYTDAWASEDTEWGEWARQNGKTIRYVADSVVMHSHNYTYRQLYGRRFVEGEADAFIYGNNDSLLSVLGRTLKSIAKDFVEQAKGGDLAELPGTPARRLVYHWGYYRGHQLGETRRDEGSDDSSIGQEFILARHDK